MTVVDTDRIEMADISDERTLDMMFEWLEPTPEGFKVEIVEGNIYMSPQRDTHWDVIIDIIEQLRARYPRQRLKSDVRIDFPGRLNGFASDVVALAEDATKDAKGRWRYQDIEFVAEVISKDTADNDYGPKKAAYATAGVPVYVIVDPYTGTWHLHTIPKDDEYRSVLSLDFGTPIDLTSTVVGLTLETGGFPRD
ncbi:Uma2 family endonuclease [Streptomyces sp. NBC_01221]|uniref:Uma2 family endonuclease n=1 Tax=unclassified Streptomyces TaxID=2593676 RepID=UPI00225BD319|nr:MULTISPECIES: Uma2 family endonuclease [unclassified Streptomyces]WSP56672.1 Uma2 family endonuclease [Streptomyces sp. NBC_01241]WSU22610.1 Uma2 family endonuclease [Streptomyces sp. NBC_01108]MCX4788420.1 Uma2 family endonuclease [Streptomyces sp. NBC_01221]MCX4795819.1 Uma2 family endonuclease [Streptomyces sp. NBC_01242]WSJ37102.1 Uma2 family endonuclease [Streptomyces sp. NBC_01321]